MGKFLREIGKGISSVFFFFVICSAAFFAFKDCSAGMAAAREHKNREINERREQVKLLRKISKCSCQGASNDT